MLKDFKFVGADEVDIKIEEEIIQEKINKIKKEIEDANVRLELKKKNRDKMLFECHALCEASTALMANCIRNVTRAAA